MSTKRIGIIDSGIGGLCLLKDLMGKNLDVEYFYVSDQYNVPYGEKTQEFMLERTSLMVEKLKAKNVDLILLACNTLTVHTINKLRQNFKGQFVGIEPYINYLNKCQDPQKKMALILTEATYKSERFNELQSQFDTEAVVDVYPLKNLALLIEKLGTQGLRFEDIKAEVVRELEPLKGKGYTHLILGCTHYPIIKNLLESELKLKTIDPHSNVANRVQEVLGAKGDVKTSKKLWYSPDINDTWEEKNISELLAFY